MTRETSGEGCGWRTADLVGLAPAAALLAVSVVLGTFPDLADLVAVLGVPLPGGASAVGAIGLHALLLVAALHGAPAWVQPLGLGRRGRFLHVALWVTVLASSWASVVPRAGRTVAILMPAWILLPAAVARCWRSAPARRLGTTAVAWAVAAVGALALADLWRAGAPRAAMPLGHHNLLALWLLALLPVALVAGRGTAAGRAGAVAATVLGGGALLTSGSLAGGLGLVAVLLAAAARRALAGDREERRRRRAAALGLAAAAVALLVAVGPRLADVALGRDPSTAARLGYARAALDGLRARPILGWGPGSVPWTVSEWLRPVPGVNPPHELVGDVHSLPLQVLYELGATGGLFAAAVVLLFPWRRLVALPVAADPALVRGGLLGLLGAGVALLAAAPVAVPAVPWALALAAGAALAGEGPGRWPLEERRSLRELPAWAYAAVAAFLLWPQDAAHLAYDRSLAAGGGARGALARAVRLDPEFPLYRAHLAASRPASGPGAAEEAVRAAEGAWGVAGLWLLAGSAALEAGEPWAAIALERACRLDPLGATAPFLLAASDPGAAEAPERAARALAAEPRLAAATLFARRPELLAAALAELSRWDGIDPAWRRAMADAVAGLGPAGRGGTAELRVAVDRRGSESLALHLFRRGPRPLGLGPVAVDSSRAAALTLPPATALPGTSPGAFSERGCRSLGDIDPSP
jgi:hypothetical protein